MKVKRGNIYLADMDPAIGSEQGGIRPVLVLQNNRGNKYSPTTIVASITAKAGSKKHLPTHFIIPSELGLKSCSLLMLEQIRVIDQSRLIKKIGKLPSHYMHIVDSKIRISLGLDERRK